MEVQYFCAHAIVTITPKCGYERLKLYLHLLEKNDRDWDVSIFFYFSFHTRSEKFYLYKLFPLYLLFLYITKMNCQLSPVNTPVITAMFI